MRFIGQPVLKQIDAELSEAIVNALDFLTAPPGTPDWFYAEECYRRLRVEEGHRLQALSSKMHTILEEGGHPALTPEELNLAADVVECVETLERKITERRESTVSGIAAIAGLAMTALGLAAFLT